MFTSYKARAWTPGGVLLLCLGLSLTLNVLLARRTGEQRRLIDRIRIENQPLQNQAVPPLVGTDVAGQPVSLTYSDTSQPTVLYVFSPGCGWCAKNHENTVALMEQLQTNFRIVGVALSSEGLEDYLRRNPMNCPIVTNIDSQLVDTYRLGVTPQTIVVSTDGVVQRNWRGAYKDDYQRQMQEYFQISLPSMKAE